MVWYRGLAEEVTKDSPLSETTGVDERKPTLKDKGMRRPDDHEANGSGPLQTLTRYALALLAAGIGTLDFVKQAAEAIEAQVRCTPRRRAAASRSMAGSGSSARRARSPSATAQATQRVPG